MPPDPPPVTVPGGLPDGPPGGLPDGPPGGLPDGDFPLRRFLGMAMEAAGPGRARARLVVSGDHHNPNGVVHGAVLFAMVDTAMGHATITVLDGGRRCASVDVQLRFIRPAIAGTLVAEASVVRRGRSIVHLDARVEDGDGRLVATAAGTFAILEP